MEREAWTLAEAVTWPAAEVDPRLRVSDRALLRLAKVARRVWPRVEREPAGSPLRRRLIERLMHLGWAVTNTQRVDDLQPLFHEDVVGFSGAGIAPEFGPVVHGWDAYRVAMDSVLSAGSMHVRSHAFIDFGGARFGVRGSMTITGPASGIAAATEFATVYEVRDGRCARQWTSADDTEIDAWLAARRAELEAGGA